MNVSDALKSRRAVKHYDTSHTMPDEDFKFLMQSVMHSPSSFNIQHWRFVDVTDTEKRQKIRAATWDQAQVTEASKLLVLCADVNAWKKDPDQYWAQAPEEVANILVPMIKQFYEGREWIQRDEAMRSVGIVAQSLMLQAIEMGYDTCPMIGFDQEAVGKIINLPDDHVIGMMIALGKRAQEPHDRGNMIAIEQAVVINNF